MSRDPLRPVDFRQSRRRRPEFVLFVRPRVRRYSRNTEASLAAWLQNQDRHLRRLVVASPRELQLDYDGTTLSGRYRYTQGAFVQTARVLSPGLARFIPDFAGAIPLPDPRSRLVDFRAAIRMWNDVVDRRFDLLSGFRLLRNEEDRTLDGLLGPKHSYLGNWSFYEQVRAHAESAGFGFSGALVCGGRLGVWFRGSALPTISWEDETWWVRLGAYFANSETGDFAVRGAPALMVPDGVCLGEGLVAGRLRHIGGQEWASRVSRLCDAVLREAARLPDQVKSSGEILAQSLGFREPYSREEVQSRRGELGRLLQSRQVPSSLAEAVVLRATSPSMDDFSYRSPAHFFPRLRVGHLVSALLFTARSQDLIRREHLEKAAFDILSGRTTVSSEAA